MTARGELRVRDRNAATGVGPCLSVARGLTAAMDGTPTAEDTPGGGLTVVVPLPAAGTPVITPEVIG